MLTSDHEERLSRQRDEDVSSSRRKRARDDRDDIPDNRERRRNDERKKRRGRSRDRSRDRKDERKDNMGHQRTDEGRERRERDDKEEKSKTPEETKKDDQNSESKKKESILTRAGGAYIPPAKLKMLREQIEDKSSSEYQRLSWEALKKSINGLINKSLLLLLGGAYIPPAKLKMLREQIEDKSSSEYQRLSWEALKKSINGLINKVNTSNLGNIIRELFQENVVRGRGLLAQAIIKAQSSSPTFTHVYAALVSVINTKFPKIGELILRRLILLFRRSYRRNNKAICLSATRFIAHLVNQQV
ncbi:pre-mRNA-splicing factor CWC22 homolog, partial [Paramuricea clavata]